MSYRFHINNADSILLNFHLILFSSISNLCKHVQSPSINMTSRMPRWEVWSDMRLATDNVIISNLHTIKQNIYSWRLSTHLNKVQFCFTILCLNVIYIEIQNMTIR